MGKNFNNQEMKKVNNDGFIATSYWDKSIRLVTVDGDGNEVDCYDKVVDELKCKEDNITLYYKKEERKNKWINFRYNLQRRMLISNIVITFLTFFMYVIFVINGKVDIIYKSEAFIADKLYAPLYKNLCKIVSPINCAILECIKDYGFENLFNYILMALSVVSFISLLVYMVGRNHITVRWICYITKIKPLCIIKEESDKRFNRLKADMYKLQLRQHKVKFAEHKR